MKINLIRNIETQRDKEQEDSFEETMNLALYFNINKKITKIDGWKNINIKKLVANILENVSEGSEIDIEFSKWNDNIDYIFENLKHELNVINYLNLDENIQISLRKRDFLTIHNYLSEIKDDKNLKLEFLFSVAETLENNLEAMFIINEFINNGISTIDVAIDSILPLLFLQEEK